MIAGVILLFMAIAVVTPLVFFALVKLVGKYFALTVEKDSLLGDKLSR